jgi:hypothetical protein
MLAMALSLYHTVPYFFRVPTWLTSLVTALQCILSVVCDGQMSVSSFLLQKMSVVEQLSSRIHAGLTL